MSFYNTLESHGLEIGITNGFSSEGHLMLDLENDLIIDAINSKSLDLLDALLFVSKKAKEIRAIYVFDRFEHYFIQGGGWERALSRCTTNKLLEYKKQAELVLWSELSSEKQKQEARIYLNAMDGDFQKHIPTATDIKTRKLQKYQKSRGKWLQLLIEDRPYKCHLCDIKKNLRIKHLVTIMNGGKTELSNLQFRCTKCVNK